MSASAQDRIWWLPAGVFQPSGNSIFDGFLRHDCSMSAQPWPVARESLDPMALGTCRYCGERLPIPRRGAGKPSRETEL